MVTLEQKKKNKQYILDNFDKYIVDSRGGFFHIDPEMLGEGENSEYCYLSKSSLTPEDDKEIAVKILETISQNLEDWELDLSGFYINFRHKKSLKIMSWEGLSKKLDFVVMYELVGKFGYRKNIWDKYEETLRILRGGDEKLGEENLFDNNDNTQSFSSKNQLGNQKPLLSSKNYSSPKPSSPEEKPSTSPPRKADESNNNSSSPPNNQSVNHNTHSPSIILNKNKVKQQIQQLLASKNLKVSQLNPNLWKDYAGWEDKLNQLNSQEKVAALQLEMEHEISQKSKTQTILKTKSEKFPLSVKIGLGGVILVSLVLIIWGIVKKKKLWKKSIRSRL